MQQAVLGQDGSISEPPDRVPILMAARHGVEKGGISRGDPGIGNEAGGVQLALKMPALALQLDLPRMPGASLPTRLAYASALVGTTAYVIGFAASLWLPEPTREELPD